MRNFGKTEHDITHLFSNGMNFYYDDHHYHVVLCGKPKPPKGECKTDTYIKAIDENQTAREFKITIKQSNAEFLENKMGLERAKEIFGENAQTIIKESLYRIAKNFTDDFLIHVQKGHHTDAKSIRLGWKFELLRKDGGRRAGKIKLTPEQKLNIIAGTALSRDKKDSKVNGVKIINSGVANMYLEVSPGKNDLDTVLSKMIPVEEFIKDYSDDVYFSCKALNYRVEEGKWDGDRPLSVYVDWSIKDNKLSGNLVMDHPLEHCGNEIGENVKRLLKQLKIDASNFESIRNHVTQETKVY